MCHKSKQDTVPAPSIWLNLNVLDSINSGTRHPYALLRVQTMQHCTAKWQILFFSVYPVQHWPFYWANLMTGGKDKVYAARRLAILPSKESILKINMYISEVTPTGVRTTVLSRSPFLDGGLKIMFNNHLFPSRILNSVDIYFIERHLRNCSLLARQGSNYIQSIINHFKLDGERWTAVFCTELYCHLV